MNRVDEGASERTEGNVESLISFDIEPLFSTAFESVGNPDKQQLSCLILKNQLEINSN